MDKRYLNHDTVTVILKGAEDSPLVYKNANINYEDTDKHLIISCNVSLPTNEDKTEYKDYDLIERIPFSNILRYYSLDETECE